MPERKLRVFLCHASQDKPVVRELYQRLLAEGWIDPWLDEDKLLPGQDWDMEVKQAVEITDAVIICLSRTSISKEGYVQKEIKKVLDAAEQKPEGTIFLIPLRLEECRVPRSLTKWHWVNYFGHENEQNYRSLLLSLETRQQQVLRFEEEEATQKIDKRESHREEDELKRTIQELQALQEIDKFIMSTLDMEEVLNRILNEGALSVRAHIGSIQLLDSTTQELVFRAYTSGIQEDLILHKMKLVEGIAGRAAAEKRSILVSDFKKYEDPSILKMDDQSESGLSVPILGIDQLIGVLSFESSEPNHFSKHDQMFLEALAGKGVIAIRNANMYDAIQSEMRRRYNAKGEF